jgi:hypothetical protein
MRFGASLAWLGAILLIPSLVNAQDPGPPGPYIVDLRVVMTGLPNDPSFFPTVPSSTLVPTRTLGFDVGGHVYLLQFGPARVGIGGSLLRVKGQASPPRPSGTTSTSSPPQTVPSVDSTVTGLTPQLSLNFGSSTGWSYVSAGVGQTRFRSTASAYASGSGSLASTVAARVLDLERRQTINVGGGARWFLNTHVAFSFDVRFHMVAARASEAGRTPKTNLIAAGAGVSFR